VARTGTEAGTGSVEGTSVEVEDVERRGKKDNLVVVEEKVVLVVAEVLVKMGEVNDEGKEEDMEDGTVEEIVGHFFTRSGDKYWAVHSSSSSSTSSDSSLVTAPQVEGSQALALGSILALALASSTVSFPPP